jgi:hypothetical protein
VCVCVCVCVCRYDAGFEALSEQQLANLFKRVVYNWHAIPASNPDEDDVGYAVYPFACNFNHACAPTCKWEIERGSGDFVAIALKDIEAQSELTISYFGHDTDRITEQRRQYLRDNYQFQCDCVRCVREADCAVCGREGWLRCGKCKSVHYCGSGCQRTDWPLHKRTCGAK